MKKLIEFQTKYLDSSISESVEDGMYCNNEKMKK